MSKMGQISAEMDEQNIPNENRNSLINRVSAGMHAAEKKIDLVVTKDNIIKKEAKPTKTLTKRVKVSEVQDDVMDALAKKIRAFADKTHNVVTLDGKNYVRAGVYQYLASLLHLTPDFDFEPESTQEEVWCICTLRDKTGNRISHTTMYACKKEQFLSDKADFAVLGMAQTRAFVRAMKNLYGYLIEYAGYQSVAIEEIDKKEK